MIFYFTGTGNSLYAAKILDENIVSIPQVLNSDSMIFEAKKIGIVCPVYGHEIPKMVKEFIKKSHFKTTYLYVVLTYGKRHANAVELVENVLKESDKKADYIATLNMVDNFLPVFDMNEEMSIDKEVEKQLAKIKADVQSETHQIENVLPLDRAIHKMYLAFVKNAPETVWADFSVTDDCVGCGICTKVCPANCIHLKDQKAVHKSENCQACFACIHACPKFAIKMNIPEKNPDARYRNKHISLCEIVSANNQTEN